MSVVCPYLLRYRRVVLPHRVSPCAEDRLHQVFRPDGCVPEAEGPPVPVPGCVSLPFDEAHDGDEVGRPTEEAVCYGGRGGESEERRILVRVCVCVEEAAGRFFLFLHISLLTCFDHAKAGPLFCVQDPVVAKGVNDEDLLDR